MSIATVLTEPASMLVAEVHTNVSCNAANDGAINITISAGTPAYSYRWSDNVLTEDRTGLAPNNYSITVTDNNACTASASSIEAGSVSTVAILTVQAILSVTITEKFPATTALISSVTAALLHK